MIEAAGAAVHEIIDRLGPSLFIWLCIVGLLVLASVIYRQAKFKPLSAKPPPNALFTETWTSGRATTHLLARGGIQNGLMVAVTAKELIVQPHFPATLAFVPDFLDIDHVVPAARIRSVHEVLTGWINLTRAVEVAFDTDKGPRTLHLWLRNPAAFILAINDMQK